MEIGIDRVTSGLVFHTPRQITEIQCILNFWISTFGNLNIIYQYRTSCVWLYWLLVVHVPSDEWWTALALSYSEPEIRQWGNWSHNLRHTPFCHQAVVRTLLSNISTKKKVIIVLGDFLSIVKHSPCHFVWHGRKETSVPVLMGKKKGVY